jgi:hypothetical protein
MEPTITQNGALFALQTRPAKTLAKRNHRPSYEARTANAGKPTSTLRTSVGEFAFRQTPLGCHLELIVGSGRWALGLYGTNEAAVRALKNRRTGFRTWDALKRKVAATQIRTLSRWKTADRASTQYSTALDSRRLSIPRKYDA